MCFLCIRYYIFFAAAAAAAAATTGEMCFEKCFKMIFFAKSMFFQATLTKNVVFYTKTLLLSS